MAQQIRAYGQLDDTHGFLPIPMTGYRTTLPNVCNRDWTGVTTPLHNERVAAWVTEAARDNGHGR
ncbi:MAG: hypothetical protein IPL28_16860 [Chloroflexi bacterium]|nr:hypothetical protein [Chloroflexota bacterium]